MTLCVYMYIFVSVLLNKFVICYLLLQFSTDFYKVWFSRIRMKFFRFRLKINPEKSGSGEKSGIFEQKTFYNITLSRFCRFTWSFATCQCQYSPWNLDKNKFLKKSLGTPTDPWISQTDDERTAREARMSASGSNIWLS